jgi:tetratricopeptide (TPR) repeat protein
MIEMSHLYNFERGKPMPSRIRDFYSQALDFERQGKFEEAKKMYQKVLEIDPSNNQAKHRLSILQNVTDRARKLQNRREEEQQIEREEQQRLASRVGEIEEALRYYFPDALRQDIVVTISKYTDDPYWEFEWNAFVKYPIKKFDFVLLDPQLDPPYYLTNKLDIGGLYDLLRDNAEVCLSSYTIQVVPPFIEITFGLNRDFDSGYSSMSEQVPFPPLPDSSEIDESFNNALHVSIKSILTQIEKSKILKEGISDYYEFRLASKDFAEYFMIHHWNIHVSQTENHKESFEKLVELCSEVMIEYEKKDEIQIQMDGKEYRMRPVKVPHRRAFFGLTLFLLDRDKV